MHEDTQRRLDALPPEWKASYEESLAKAKREWILNIPLNEGAFALGWFMGYDIEQRFLKDLGI